MNKLPSDWLDLFFYFHSFNKSSSFFSELNRQLQNEFYLLTNNKFDGKKFYLIFYTLEESLSYLEDNSMPYGKLNMKLEFYKERMNVSIVWFDRESKKLYKLGDDVENSNIEFHWYDFDVNHPALREVGSRKKDIRKKFQWDVSFKVVSRIDVFEDLDLFLNIPIRSKDKFEQVNLIMKTAQESWNAGAVDTEKYPINQTGLVHNLGFEEFEDAGKAVYSIDMGTADFSFLKYLFTLLDEANLGIKQIEISE